MNENILYPILQEGLLESDQKGQLVIGAHQNLCWELTGNRQFDPKNGMFSDFMRETSRHTGDIVLSSEEFESILNLPERIEDLNNVALQTGRNLVLVVYLRDQISYSESIYQEGLKHGSGKEYKKHISLILETEFLSYKDGINHFDYYKIFDKIQRVSNIEIIVRNYHRLVMESIVQDFGYCIESRTLQDSISVYNRINVRDPLRNSLFRFYVNRTGLRPTFPEIARMNFLADAASNPVSGWDTRRRFIERFRDGNNALCARFGLPTVGLDMKDEADRNSAVTLEQLFSFETQHAIRTGRRLKSLGRDALETEWMEGVEHLDSKIKKSEILGFKAKRLMSYGRWYGDKFRGFGYKLRDALRR